MHNFKSVLKSKKQLTDTVYEIKFSIPKNFTFEPGQFVSVLVAPKIRRSYSILSVKEGVMTLVVDVAPGGVGSMYFLKALEGDETNILGPLGFFRYNKTQFNKVFISTGTGIVPFVSMIENIDVMKNSGVESYIDLYHGARSLKDDISSMYLKEPIEKKIVRLTMCITQPEANDSGYEKGRVTEIVPKKDYDWGNTEFYICGMRSMIEDMHNVLKAKGAERIYYEKY